MLAGAHVSTAGGIHTAIDRAVERGADAVQIFTQSPRAWRPTNHPPANLERFKARRAEEGIGAAVCHALYLINLATTDETVWEKSRASLLHTVAVACAIEADGVVLHVGSHLGAGFEAGLEHALPALEEALTACGGPTWILLENSAGAGGTIGRSVDELAVLVDRLGGHPRLGLCLDSCHLWVSGVDVTDPGALDATLAEVDGRIGLDRLRCLHVNDASTPLGSNRDRHANVCAGVMGERLGVFLAHPLLQGLPMILETPGPDNHGPDAAEVARLRELHARWTGATKPGRAGRRRGRTASRGGARRTRG
ncbi:MAG TPA: deoxyribonuclease IV [Gaiellaceae bacterium]|nr:deoxyribonuclease IV [Gaiellaceae bacterium]